MAHPRRARGGAAMTELSAGAREIIVEAQDAQGNSSQYKLALPGRRGKV